MIRIRAFKATDDIDTCQKFAEGHHSVLKNYGIPVIASADTSWFNNPNIIVIVVEDIVTGEVLGGAKIQIACKGSELPFAISLGKQDKKILDIVKMYPENTLGELCGLWNAKELAGKGFSILLTRECTAKASVVVAEHLKLKSLVVLCAPWTVEMVKNVGFQVENTVGDNGAFHYPKPDLLATLLRVIDIKTLTTAKPIERDSIFDLRANPRQKRIESGPKWEGEVAYDLIGV